MPGSSMFAFTNRPTTRNEVFAVLVYDPKKGYIRHTMASPTLTFSNQHLCPALAVDLIIFTVRKNRLQILLIQRKNEPFSGRWALPGGFVRMNESLEDAALRELEEETGLRDVYLEQLYTYGDPGRDPRGHVVTVAYFALIPSDTPIRPEGGDDASQAKWFPRDDLPPLAFDHPIIANYALRRLRYKLEYSAVGFELLPEEFTLSELQQTYEIILGESLDKRNFRRRILQAGIIEPTPHLRKGEGRPARLYRYQPDAVAEVKARRLFP
ncbi:MAG: NUDIX domain-containing protein [Chloroflexota bacterium]